MELYCRRLTNYNFVLAQRCAPSYVSAVLPVSRHLIFVWLLLSNHLSIHWICFQVVKHSCHCEMRRGKWDLSSLDGVDDEKIRLRSRQWGQPLNQNAEVEEDLQHSVTHITLEYLVRNRTEPTQYSSCISFMKLVLALKPESELTMHWLLLPYCRSWQHEITRSGRCSGGTKSSCLHPAAK